jgi:hypothetical protein
MNNSEKTSVIVVDDDNMIRVIGKIFNGQDAIALSAG